MTEQEKAAAEEKILEAFECLSEVWDMTEGKENVSKYVKHAFRDAKANLEYILRIVKTA